MTVKQKQLDEKIQTGGGATGVAQTADPVDKKATLPASNLGNGEKMNTIAHIQPGEGEQDTDAANNVKTTKDTAGSNKASVSMKEDVAAMFNGEDLSEDFREKATVIFEAAVTARISEVTSELEEQYNTVLAEEIERIEEDLSSKVDQYMSYVAEQWMEQNQVAIERSLKTEITESFINDLKSLFETHNISVPEEKFDLVDEMQTQVKELQTRLNSVMEENMSLKGDLSESTRKEILSQIVEGMAATQAEKLTTLAEGVQFDTVDNYRKKLEIVKENYFPSEKTAGKAQSLLEEVNEDQGQPQATQSVDSSVSFYAKAISRTVKK